MFDDISNKPRIDIDTQKVLQEYNFYYYDSNLQDLPFQKCGDHSYIPDETILHHYRNLNYHLISHEQYFKPVIGNIIRTGCWLVTSMDIHGIQSPLSMFETHVHPGKKRYMVANYLQVDTVPVLLQTKEVRHDLQKVTTLSDLSDIYKGNFSTRVEQKDDNMILECSWHGATNSRDSKGYDNWWKVSNEEIGSNVILDYIKKNGVGINQTDRPFYILVHDDTLQFDWWELYFHFDPTVYRKVCETGNIEIINTMSKSNETIHGCKLMRTLERPKLYG